MWKILSSRFRTVVVDSSLFLALFVSSVVASGRSPADANALANLSPGHCVTRQDINKMALIIQNNGKIGRRYWEEFYDCVTGALLKEIACEYPKGSIIEYLAVASPWVGAVVGNDTLVSAGEDLDWIRRTWWEFNPDPAPAQTMIFRSTLDPSDSESGAAVSEQDIIAVYTDTLLRNTRDNLTRRLHEPLYIEITQKSYAWSLPYAEDFVLFDFELKNVGKKTLTELYFGFHVAGYVGYYQSVTAFDQLVGLLRDYPSVHDCGLRDTINIAWMADDDGEPYQGEFIDYIVLDQNRIYKSAPDVTGVRFLKSPGYDRQFSFNWWTWGTGHLLFDFGPRHKENLRNFGTGGLGIPYGDLNQYHVLSNGEIDYDVAFTNIIEPWDPLWLYPGKTVAENIGTGAVLSYMISYGPITLGPGATTSIPLAYVGGEDLHTDPNNLDNLPHDPSAYYANLDFSDLARNAMLASWIYDNPGVDSDGDGYFGKYRVCVLDSALTDSGWVATDADTAWYEGDGIPDWKAAGPPPAPIFWVEPTVNGLHVRFNGSQTETARDLFTGIVDFEGYHIWLGRDDREQSYSLVASYDNENYDKFVWDAGLYPEPNFVLHDIPYTVEQLRCLYGDPDDPCSDSAFDPTAYTRTYPYYHPDFPESTFYFVSHNHNASDLGLTSSIRKVYPDELPPPQNAHPDSLTPDRYTEDGYLKYYEYEFTIQNLLPTVPYYVNVTTFDFGSPQEGLNPLETSKTVGQQFTYPYGSDGEMSGSDNRVYVYPNPYRIDADYRLAGYEGRTRESLPNDKVRSVHFANLPARCIIRVFSLDGDLVREIKHYRDTTDGDARDDEWNLVNRNRQLVVSGIYYWSVENLDSGETQMGKLVILM